MRAEEVFLDDPGPGEVLVSIAAAGLCRSDLHSINGHDVSPKPIILGHEAVAVVEKKGDGDNSLQIGDRVILSWMPGCGGCSGCIRGRPALCEVANHCFASGELPGGGTRMRDKNGKEIYYYSGLASFARHAVVPANGCIPLKDEGISSISASAIGCAVMTGIGAAMNAGRVRPGDSVVVFGLGGVGLNVLQGSKLAGAAIIVGVDTNAKKEKIAKQFGATHFLDGGRADILSALSDVCGGGGANVAFDAFGHPALIQKSFDAIAPGGRVVCVGISPDGTKVQIPADVIVGAEKEIVGCYYGGANSARDFPMLLNLFRNGRILLDELVEEVIPFSAIADGFDRMREGKLLGRLVANLE